MSRKCRNIDRAVSALEHFYRKVDAAVAQTVSHGGLVLHCAPGCVSCCMDGISVFWIEAENIRRKYAGILSGLPHEPGACAFLDKNGLCRIYDVRPYVCRTQGLALRWIDESPGQEPPGQEPIEMRDICPENDPGDALLDLPPSACWEIGPHESILAGIQAALDGGELSRISLRGLFKR